jgi:hypothetical protein
LQGLTCKKHEQHEIHGFDDKREQQYKRLICIKAKIKTM